MVIETNVNSHAAKETTMKVDSINMSTALNLLTFVLDKVVGFRYGTHDTLGSNDLHIALSRRIPNWNRSSRQPEGLQKCFGSNETRRSSEINPYSQVISYSSCIVFSRTYSISANRVVFFGITCWLLATTDCSQQSSRASDDHDLVLSESALSSE